MILMDEEKNVITEEEAQEVSNSIDEVTEDVNEVIESNSSEEAGESKKVITTINPDTGETQILNTDPVEDLRSFEEQVNDAIDSFDLDFNNSNPATMDEMTKLLDSDDNLLKNISKDTEMSEDDIKNILDVTNRRIHREKFNVYKCLPDNVKKMIDDYIEKDPNFMSYDKRAINTIKNNMATMIIDSFKDSINMERSKHDFAHELSNLYQEGTKTIAESSMSLMEDRNKAYREAADKIEDPEKKERLLAILDRIEAARELEELKEFAKKCKIKRIELEKPESRVFSYFINKYAESSNNIYDLKLCATILYRHLKEDGYNTDMVLAFFIAFCKMIQNWDINDPLQHSYIYYVLYYCAMLDGDKTDKFKNNAKEVIDNLIERNSGLFKREE